MIVVQVLGVSICALLTLPPLGRATLANAPKKHAAPVVPVRKLALVVGQTVPLQMQSGHPIRLAVSSDERVVRVRPTVNDPTTVLVTGVSPGRARITLTGLGGAQEVCTVGWRTGASN